VQGAVFNLGNYGKGQPVLFTAGGG
jgi:hypothetical protein